MRHPTEADCALAAQRLETLARMGMGGGIAIFADGLERVDRSARHYSHVDGDLAMDEFRVRIPSPWTYDTDKELLEACEYEISEALCARDAACRLLAQDWHHDGLTDRLREVVAGIEDPVQRSRWDDTIGEA